MRPLAVLVELLVKPSFSAQFHGLIVAADAIENEIEERSVRRLAFCWEVATSDEISP